MPRYRLGTMGFSYEDWLGVFYPRGTKSGDWLAYYARHFDTVELDTTFHAIPPVERVRRWASVVPAEFRFCVKTPKMVTHEPPVDRRVDLMRAFVDVAREFDDRLGIILLQFPPTYAFEQAPSLCKLLATLAADLRFAVEFRNPSWQIDDTANLCRDYGVTLVAAEYEVAPRSIVVTGPDVYVRMIGRHERFAELNREQMDVTGSLQIWREQIAILPARVENAYVFFNNDFSGYSVATCNRFKGMMGLAVAAPKLEQAQDTLF